MASTSSTPDRPLKLIRVRPNPVFLEPKDLPTRPLTLPPIEIKQPPNHSESCVHRADFKDVHPDILNDYAKHYDIKLDIEKVLRAEILAVLCMKNEWIPILPKHRSTVTEDGRVCLSKTESSGDPTPIGVTGEDPLKDASAELLKNATVASASDDVIEDIDLEKLAASLSTDDLAKLMSNLQGRHARLQTALQDATAATREAAADVLEMVARVESEKAKMEKLLEKISKIAGERDGDNGSKNSSEEEVEEVANFLTGHKGKEKASDPIRCSPDLPRPTPCTSCQIARDLTLSQHHSAYGCVEHDPTPGASTSSTASAANDGASSSSRDSTILFGLTTNLEVTPSSPSKGKKRSIDETEVAEDPQSPKRARVDEPQDDVVDPDVPSSRPTSPRTNPNNNIAEDENPENKEEAPRNIPLRRTMSIANLNNPRLVAHAQRQEAALLAPPTNPLKRRASIADINDPVEVANAEWAESRISSGYPVLHGLNRNPNWWKGRRQRIRPHATDNLDAAAGEGTSAARMPVVTEEKQEASTSSQHAPTNGLDQVLTNSEIKREEGSAVKIETQEASTSNQLDQDLANVKTEREEPTSSQPTNGLEQVPKVKTEEDSTANAPPEPTTTSTDGESAIGTHSGRNPPNRTLSQDTPRARRAARRAATQRPGEDASQRDGPETHSGSANEANDVSQQMPASGSGVEASTSSGQSSKSAKRARGSGDKVQGRPRKKARKAN